MDTALYADINAIEYAIFLLIKHHPLLPPIGLNINYNHVTATPVPRLETTEYHLLLSIVSDVLHSHNIYSISIFNKSIVPPPSATDSARTPSTSTCENAGTLLVESLLHHLNEQCSYGTDEKQDDWNFNLKIHCNSLIDICENILLPMIEDNNDAITLLDKITAYFVEDGTDVEIRFSECLFRFLIKLQNKYIAYLYTNTGSASDSTTSNGEVLILVEREMSVVTSILCTMVSNEICFQTLISRSPIHLKSLISSPVAGQVCASGTSSGVSPRNAVPVIASILLLITAALDTVVSAKLIPTANESDTTINDKESDTIVVTHSNLIQIMIQFSNGIETLLNQIEAVDEYLNTFHSSNLKCQPHLPQRLQSHLMIHFQEMASSKSYNTIQLMKCFIRWRDRKVKRLEQQKVEYELISNLRDVDEWNSYLESLEKASLEIERNCNNVRNTLKKLNDEKQQCEMKYKSMGSDLKLLKTTLSVLKSKVRNMEEKKISKSKEFNSYSQQISSILNISSSSSGSREMFAVDQSHRNRILLKIKKLLNCQREKMNGYKDSLALSLDHKLQLVLKRNSIVENIHLLESQMESLQIEIDNIRLKIKVEDSELTMFIGYLHHISTKLENQIQNI